MHNVDSPWRPLPVDEVMRQMHGAPFFWCLAGGRAIERVVGRPYRQHEDTDIVVLRSQQLAVQEWFHEWQLAAADPPGWLRTWDPGEKLPWRVHDVWAHRAEAVGWELQIMIQEDDAESWYFRRDDRVHGALHALASPVDGVPCLRMDLHLLYKAKSTREVDDLDFLHLLPLLDDDQCRELAHWLRLTCPNGHRWLVALEAHLQRSR